MIWLLAICLAGDGPMDVWHENAFALIQEEWAIGAANAKGCGSTADIETAALIHMLGCRHYACREAAERRLMEMGGVVFQSLVWAQHHPDPNVRHTAGRLLDKMFFVCDSCHGKGKQWDGPAGGCYRCDGSGVFRY